MGKFKVGDRVRATETSGGGSIQKGDEVTLTGIEDNDYLRFDNPKNGRHDGWHAKYFEPVLPPFTIEVGESYKTRGGLRATIKWSHDGDSYDFVGLIDGVQGNRIYQKDGEHGSVNIGNKPEFDLIAKWVDVPVVAVAASNDNAAPKFKVNDNIRHKRLGHVGHVVKIIGDKHAEVFWANVGWGATDPFDSIELIDPAVIKQTAIVALIENGQPKPATRPYVHTTEESATKEAERLALLHPGQEFGVYVLAGSKIADEVITKTAVLRAA